MAKLVTLQGMGFRGIPIFGDASGLDDTFQAFFKRDGDTVFVALAVAMQGIIDNVEANRQAATSDADQAALSNELYRLRRIQEALSGANLQDLSDFPTEAEKQALISAYNGNAVTALMAILPDVALLPEKYEQTRAALISQGVPSQNIDTVATAAKDAYDPGHVAEYDVNTGELSFEASNAKKSSPLPVLAALAVGIYLATK